LIRLEWAHNAAFEDRATFAFPTRCADTPTYSTEENPSGLEIKTADLHLRYIQDGKPFHNGNLSISLTVAGQPVEWKPGKINLGNLRGTTRTLDQCTAEINLDEGLLSREGWTLFDDSDSVVWNDDQTWVEARPEEHVQDWYFFGYGHDYKGLLADY